MDVEVLRSNTVMVQSPAWQKSESIALLAAVLTYCRIQTPPLDTRHFQTDLMVHVLPHIVWPINSVVRTVNDCVRRFIRIRSAWRNSSSKRLHTDIINFIKKHRIFLEPYTQMYPSINSSTNATSTASAPIATSSNVVHPSSNPVRPTQVERVVVPPPPARQPLQETSRNTMDLTNMNVLPSTGGAASTVTFNRALPQVMRPASTASIQSMRPASTASIQPAALSLSTTPIALRTRHPASAVAPVRAPIVMPIPPANLTPAPNAKLTDVASTRHSTSNAYESPLDVEFTWYDLEKKKQRRSKRDNMTLHIKLYEDNIGDPRTTHLFQAIIKLEQRILVARRSISEAEARVRKSTDAALAVKSLFAAHAALNVPELLTKCDDLVVEDQKAFLKAGLISERLYRQLDGLWVAVEEIITNDCVCEPQLHRSLFLLGCSIDSSMPPVEVTDGLAYKSHSPLVVPPEPVQPEVIPSQPINVTRVESETVAAAVGGNNVHVITPTCRFIMSLPPLIPLVETEPLMVPVENTMSVDESSPMDLTLDESIVAPSSPTTTTTASEAVVVDQMPLEDAPVAHPIDDLTLVARESPKRLRDYDADAELDMRPPSPKQVAPTPSTHLANIVRDGKYIVDASSETHAKVEATYQFKLFAEKNGPEATILVRTCKLASCHSRIRHDIKLTLEEFNELLYLSPIDRKEVASTCGRGKAVNGKYDKFDLVLSTSALKRFGRRGYADKYGGGFYIIRKE